MNTAIHRLLVVLGVVLLAPVAVMLAVLLYLVGLTLLRAI